MDDSFLAKIGGNYHKSLYKLRGSYMKKLPNGFGQISKIKGLKNPYRAMITVGKDINGRPISRMLQPKSYFKTYKEAYEALVEYHSADRPSKEKEYVESRPHKTFTRSEVLALLNNYTPNSTESIILTQMYTGLQYYEIVDVYKYSYKNYKRDFYHTVGPGHHLSDPLEYYEWFKKNRGLA